MKKKLSTRKLTLQREVVRTLTENQAARAQGAGPIIVSILVTCNTCYNTCPPSCYDWMCWSYERTVCTKTGQKA